MSSVVDITEIINQKKFLDKLTKLWQLNEQSEQEILDNPFPFLEKAALETLEYYTLIDKVKYILDPPIMLSNDQECNISTDYKYEAFCKVERALKLVREFESSREGSSS